MTVGQVILIIISGLGVFHGLFLAITLWGANTAGTISNRILSLMMLAFSLRVGKSVIMAFTENLPTLYVYLGLCLMLLIGPLYLLYSKSLINRALHIHATEFFHFVPGVVFILLAIPMQITGFENIPDFIAGLQFAIFYIHFLCYILFVKQKIIPQAGGVSPIKTWLTILFYGLLAIWLEYVLNLFEEQVPYILGPIIYSITVYYITYLAFKHKYLTAIHTVKYQTANFSASETKELFARIEDLVKKQKGFLEPDISLASLSKQFRSSNQKISFVINTMAGCNFNEYINRYRVAYAIDLLNQPQGKGR